MEPIGLGSVAARIAFDPWLWLRGRQVGPYALCEPIKRGAPVPFPEVLDRGQLDPKSPPKKRRGRARWSDGSRSGRAIRRLQYEPGANADGGIAKADLTQTSLQREERLVIGRLNRRSSSVSFEHSTAPRVGQSPFGAPLAPLRIPLWCLAPPRKSRWWPRTGDIPPESANRVATCWYGHGDPSRACR